MPELLDRRELAPSAPKSVAWAPGWLFTDHPPASKPQPATVAATQPATAERQPASHDHHALTWEPVAEHLQSQPCKANWVCKVCGGSGLIVEEDSYFGSLLSPCPDDACRAGSWWVPPEMSYAWQLDQQRLAPDTRRPRKRTDAPLLD
jgi:hypothetical protein